MAETKEELVQRLRKYEKEARDTAANCEVVAAALAGQIEALEARTGHNTYAVRLAVDHRNSAKRERQFADDIAAVLARMAGPGEVVVPQTMTDEMFNAARQVYDDDENANAVKLWNAVLAAVAQKLTGEGK